MTVALAAASCRVVEGDVTNPTTNDRIAEFCAGLFEEKVSEALTYFYNTYYIARFVQGDAELKVSPEYDLIRTGLTTENGIYSYGYRPYDFHGEDFFGGVALRCLPMRKFRMTCAMQVSFEPQSMSIALWISSEGMAFKASMIVARSYPPTCITEFSALIG